MKNIFLPFIVFLATLFITGCTKTDSNVKGVPDEVTSVEYEYNTATKKFTPEGDVTAQIISPTGVRHIYSYLIRSDAPDSLVNIHFASDASTAGNTNLVIPASLFANINMSSVTGIKLMIKHLDNTSHEDFIKVSSFTPEMPTLKNFEESIVPDDNDMVHITGDAHSSNGIVSIEIMDDSQGDYTVVHTISNLNNATDYSVDYNYTYRPNAGNIKIILTDKFDLKAEVIIRMPILPYEIYQDVMMGAQGTSNVTVNNNIFFLATGTTLGSCEIPANEATMDFLFYGTSSGPTFYSPSNTTNVARNFRCNNVPWEIANPSDLKATRFRVLTPGSSTEVDNIYSNFASNSIPDLDDEGFFDGVPVPSSSTVRYIEPPGATSTSLFNTTDTYLIWVRVPGAGGSFRNALIRAKEVVAASTAGLSTIKFDIYVQK